MKDAADDAQGSPPYRLARLLALEESSEGDWLPEELGALFQHQWSAPVAFDLAVLGSSVAAKMRTLSESQGLLLKSYRDLFLHPCPPLELLVLTKEFAKAHQGNPESPLPREISLALYYTAIFSAWIQLGQRISALDDLALRQAAECMLAQPWMDEPTKALFREGLERLERQRAGAAPRA